MNALSMAVGGGFFGTAVALTLGFFVVRQHVQSAFDDAHTETM
jgi:ABC-type phosphate/phosphonate transport system permease subunit